MRRLREVESWLVRSCLASLKAGKSAGSGASRQAFSYQEEVVRRPVYIVGRGNLMVSIPIDMGALFGLWVTGAEAG